MDGWIPGLTLLSIAAAAVWFDVRARRVPNALTLPALLAGLTLAVLGQGAVGFGGAMAGAGLCLAVALPLFLVGGLGGGDVKLMAAFGAFLGPDQLLTAFVTMALAGGVMALVAMIRKRAIGRTFRNLWLLGMTLGRRTFTGWKGEKSEAWLTLESADAITVPYAVAIAAGALLAWFT